jgi:(E)-4-hydroxy-3-methyl-but-2-enyl pyrophosphate reductase
LPTSQTKTREKHKNLRILVSDSVGFCSGVRRAIKIALAAAGRSECGIYSMGPLIHNPQVVEKLKQVGVKPLVRIGKKGGALVLRSHGVSRPVLDQARRRGYKIIDATCPFVRKAQDNARKLSEKGYRVVIVGDRHHPEVKTIRSHVRDRALVVENIDQVKRLKFGPRVGIIAQTTIPTDTFSSIVGEVTRRAKEVLVFNTICSDTARRQERAKALAGKVDVLLVVGGRNSANTSRLATLCETICPRIHHIETADEIEGRWFRNNYSVGIVAGSSTPGWLVDSIVDRLREL